MRSFTGGDGSDTTSAVLTYLATAKQLALADLMLIGEPEDTDATWLTTWNSPLSWPIWGTFQPGVTNRGKVSSEIGLQVDSFELEWSPPLTAFGTTIATANPYQKAQTGFYDNKTFRLWRTVMPTPGDANTYGACEVFGGRISEITVVRGKIILHANSFLDVINQQVPPNVIDLNNTLANFAGNTPVVADGETVVAQFTVIAPSTQQSIYGQCTAPTPNKIYADHTFRYGYLVFNPGSTLAGYWSPIGESGKITITGTDYNNFSMYAGFPWAPSPGDTFYCSIKPPINLQDAATGFEYFGFPYVPQPESAA